MKKSHQTRVHFVLYFNSVYLRVDVYFRHLRV